MPQISNDLEYVGFWTRVAASLIDSLLLMLVILPPLVMIYGWAYFDSTAFIQGPADLLLSWVLPILAVLLFWIKRQATPGKELLGARIVDAQSLGVASPRQLVIRYLGYYLSAIPLGLGLFWVAFDPRKQGWHDKLASTLVVRRIEPKNA
ncbi:MAG: RDD family protein [Pseudomonas sp.]|uniref:RDD family protein n=1 Tax=Pseudomonas sp. TaxID=306 RepID=UPI00339122F0